MDGIQNDSFCLMVVCVKFLKMMMKDKSTSKIIPTSSPFLIPMDAWRESALYNFKMLEQGFIYYL
jgi:hypothetical protein